MSPTQQEFAELSGTVAKLLSFSDPPHWTKRWVLSLDFKQSCPQKPEITSPLRCSQCTLPWSCSKTKNSQLRAPSSTPSHGGPRPATGLWARPRLGGGGELDILTRAEDGVRQGHGDPIDGASFAIDGAHHHLGREGSPGPVGRGEGDESGVSGAH